MPLSGKCFISSVLSRFWYYAFHRQCNPPSSFWTKNLSSDLHFNDLTNLLCVAASAIAYLMSNLFFVNTFWTLQLFFVPLKWLPRSELRFHSLRNSWGGLVASLVYLPVSSTIKTHIFLTKIAVSIDSILIMLLLEISGEHVLLMLFSFPQFRLSCKGDNKFTDFGKASEPVKSKFI